LGHHEGILKHHDPGNEAPGHDRDRKAFGRPQQSPDGKLGNNQPQCTPHGHGHDAFVGARAIPAASARRNIVIPSPLRTDYDHRKKLQDKRSHGAYRQQRRRNPPSPSALMMHGVIVGASRKRSLESCPMATNNPRVTVQNSDYPLT
jgi:hypothetical protein